MTKLFSLCLLSLMFFCALMPSKGSAANWVSYDSAIQTASRENKPIALFFTGSDWCVWCQRLEKESLETQAFDSALQNKILFVKVDFPRRTQLDPGTTSRNEELQRKYRINGFPTIVLIDANGSQIGVTGYRPGGGKAFAEHLLKMTDDFGSYKTKMKQMENNATPLSGGELKQLYRKAREFNKVDDQIKIVQKGLISDRSDYFGIERYRFLGQEGQIHDREAASLKKKLLENDPNNQKLTHFQIACIEFDAYSDEMEKENYSPEIALEPLKTYLEKFRGQDKDNEWRIEMIISQVYNDKGYNDKAIRHCQNALNCAPKERQNDIEKALAELKKS